MKIDKKWDNLADQTISGDNGDTWNMAAVVNYAKNLEVFDIPLKHLCIDCKIDNSTIKDFVSHMQMVTDANLEQPIILDDNGRIFDGRHRVAKAILDGKDSIKAVRFIKDPPVTFRETKK